MGVLLMCPRQEIIDLAVGVVIDDACEGMDQISKRVDAVELAGFDERGDDGPVLCTTVRRDLMMPGFWGTR